MTVECMILLILQIYIKRKDVIISFSRLMIKMIKLIKATYMLAHVNWSRHGNNTKLHISISIDQIKRKLKNI